MSCPHGGILRSHEKDSPTPVIQTTTQTAEKQAAPAGCTVQSFLVGEEDTHLKITSVAFGIERSFYEDVLSYEF